jgi:PKD repeat protein
MECTYPKTRRFGHLIAAAMAAFAASCAITDTPAPPLAGPSEMSLSLAISANPDTLSLDGASQSQIVIEARDANGQPASNVPLRPEIIVDGVAVDYGTLSARSLVTGSNGRASFMYTAPMLVPGPIPDVQLSITPTGTDASAHVRRVVSIRLVPPGVISPGGPTPAFTSTPALPTAFQDVLFDASSSRAAIGTAISTYSWNFGDGGTGSGVKPSHRFSDGTFMVTLTVTDTNGFSASTSQIITVGPGTPPTAVFVFSPLRPKAGQTVFFNASQSTPGPGRRVSTHRWNWGDGGTDSGATESHIFKTDGVFAVVLTVTDDVGQRGTTSAQVTVCPATGCDEEE